MPLGTINTSTTEYFTPPVAATVTVLPPDVYEIESGVYRMAFSQEIWRPNDDSGFYYLQVEDDYDSSDSDDDFEDSDEEPETDLRHLERKNIIGPWNHPLPKEST